MVKRIMIGKRMGILKIMTQSLLNSEDNEDSEENDENIQKNENNNESEECEESDECEESEEGNDETMNDIGSKVTEMNGKENERDGNNRLKERVKGFEE
jgi:hypothetical protein